MERRLAAIMATDVVGYSRLIRVDEEGTLEALKALRADLIDPKIAEHHGRTVKLMGDGMLVEFASVVDAVHAAVETQQALAIHNADVPADKVIELRIGINLGDVVIDGDDIQGDGVNVAARLEAMAEPGGICVSGMVYEGVRDRIDDPFEDLGEKAVKNIDRPVRVYHWQSGAQPSGDTVGASLDPANRTKPRSADRDNDPDAINVDLSIPDDPSIAVLPFTNMSGDPEQEFFSDGITEDIITALSKIKSLLVVARTSTFTYKGKAVDVRQVSREQGVRYVLEGSVRKAGNRVRVTAQLIDGTTGHHVWAERYDRDLEDIFAVQDEITREVVVALDVHLREGEQARVWSGGTKNVEAWECVRLGQDALNRVTANDRIEARRLFDRALELDPNYPMAWFSLGRAYFHEAEHGTGYDTEADRDALLESAVAYATKAFELDPSCADAYASAGICLLSMGEHDEAVAMSEKAIALAPNHAQNLAIAAAVLNKSGQPERSFELIKRAMRLCPIYPSWYLYVLANACRLLHRNESAVGVLQEAIRRNPENHPALHIGLASTLGELGQDEDAKRTAAVILRLEPDFSIQKYARRLAYRDPTELTRFEDGLRKAGLPE